MTRTVLPILVCILLPVASHAATGMVYVKSTPPGATVFIDGENKGTTNVLH